MTKRTLSASRKHKLDRLLKACDKAREQADKHINDAFIALEVFEAEVCGFPVDQAPELIEEYRRLFSLMYAGENPMHLPCDEHGRPIEQSTVTGSIGDGEQ